MMTPLSPSSRAYWPVSNSCAGVLQPDHRRDAQRPRHDGRVRGPAAHVRGEAQHLALVQLRRVGRRQVVADDDARLLEMPQVALLVHAEQIVEHADGDVAHVGRPFAQVIVLDGRQRRRVAFGDGVEGVLRVDLLRLDHAHDLVQQRAVLQHQQMRVEDAAFLGAHAFAHLALDLEDLLPGLHQRPLQPVDLFRQLRVGELAPGDGRTRPAEHEDLAAAHPGGNRYAAEDLLTLAAAALAWTILI